VRLCKGFDILRSGAKADPMARLRALVEEAERVDDLLSAA
jgi:hypothetical protein